MKRKNCQKLISGFLSVILFLSISVNACAISAFVMDVPVPPAGGNIEPNFAWYSHAIYRLWYAYVLEPSADDPALYKPDSGITREEFLVFLGKLAKECGNKPIDILSDEEDRAVRFTQWALENHILYGRGNSLAGKEYLTRQEMVVFLMRFANYMELELKVSNKADDYERFADFDSVSSWAEESMKKACSSQIVSGVKTKDGTCLLKPQRIATRAEAAQIIYNYVKVSGMSLPSYIGDVDVYE